MLLPCERGDGGHPGTFSTKLSINLETTGLGPALQSFSKPLSLPVEEP